MKAKHVIIILIIAAVTIAGAYADWWAFNQKFPHASFCMTVPSRKDAVALDRLAASAHAALRHNHRHAVKPCCSIRDKVDEFLRDSRLGLNRRAVNDETARRHRRRLIAFDRAFHSQPLDAILPAELEGWITRCKARGGVDGDTVNADLVALYAFARWSQKKGYAPDVLPVMKVGRLQVSGKLPGMNRKPPKALERDEGLGIIERIKTEREDVGLILVGMFLFLLRPAALCRLRRRDVILPRGDSPGRLGSKGLKGFFDHDVPILPGSAQHAWAEACLALAKRHGRRAHPDSPFIINISGRGRRNPGGWTTDQLGYMVKRICDRLGMCFRSYQTRHTVISALLGEKGVSIGEVQSGAGHRKATTTDIYNQRTARDAIPAYERASDMVRAKGLLFQENLQ